MVNCRGLDMLYTLPSLIPVTALHGAPPHERLPNVQCKTLLLQPAFCAGAE